MKLKHLILPAVAIAGAATLLVPQEAEAFNAFGYSLPLSQRDVRVFNNFSKAQTNNNTFADPNWPGYDGAELAIWKGCAEWQSTLFGDGSGDPHQNFGLGSGGANFDVVWLGNATDVGAPGQNIHSEIGGSQGGVLAFTEGPGESGWRIRYYQNWNWQDGPGLGEGGIDLQGVAAHEYGHALGLNHTNAAGATMRPSISGSGVSARSIAPDDIAGVQFIYGVKDLQKATITGVSAATGVVTIDGFNFAPSGNEVWFTPAGPVVPADDDPVKVTGVDSTNSGTRITLVTPAGVTAGNVLVRIPGIFAWSLSNAMPVSPQIGSPCSVTTYCTGKINSNGSTANIATTGTPSFAVNDFQLMCFNGFIPNTLGIHFWSDTGQAVIPFFNGTLCIAPPTTRGAGHQYNTLGEVTVPITIQASDIGNMRWYQFWFRDANHPDGTGVGLSDAVEVLHCN